MTSLVEQLEKLCPIAFHHAAGPMVNLDNYMTLRQIAIELAKACEWTVQIDANLANGCVRALAKCQDILNEGK